MGTIRERSKGVYEVRVFLGRDPVTNTPRQVSRTVRGGIRAARAKVAELELDAAQGKMAGTDVTVAVLLERYFDFLDHKGLSPQTVHGYRRYARVHLVPAFGQRPVRKLTGWDLDAFYTAMASPAPGSDGSKRGRGPATIRQAHAIMSGALGQAVKWGWVPVNAAKMASPPKVPRANITVPTAAQVRALLTAADRRDAILGRMVMLAAITGARRGELCALRWSDVDLDAGTVSIARSVLDLPGRVEEKDTKSHAGRTVSLGEAGVTLLTLHRKDTSRVASEAGTQLRADGFVFSTTSFDGTSLVRPDHLTAFFNRVRDELGYDGLTLHGLRHFVATQLASRGDVSARTLAGRLGHADASVTMRVYAAFFPAADVEAAAHMDRVLAEGN
jgi:integrase